MKKMKLLVLGCGLLLVTSFAPKQTLIKENKDLILSCEEKNNVGINLKKLATTSSATVGKTYVQNGEYDANKMLRFATPVNGDFDSLTYHIEIEGYPEVVSKNVETVYKGIETNGTVSYFNGTDVVTKEDELTKEWYWACFTIEFTSYKYYTASINAYVTGSSSLVEGELKSEAKNDVSLRDELMKGDTPSLKALDTKTLGEWRNDGATIVVDGKKNQLTYSKDGVDTVLNYVNFADRFYVFSDGNENVLNIRYIDENVDAKKNPLGVYGTINETKMNYYVSFSKFVSITSLTLTTKKTELVYKLDNAFTINATTNKDATGEDIFWECSDNRFDFEKTGPSIYVSVPTLDELVSNDSKVESIKVTFTAKSAGGKASCSTDITIRRKIKVTEITLTQSSAEIEVGNTFQINASVNEDADIKDLVYEAKDKKIATVSSTGLITGVKEGSTTISVKTTDGSNLEKTFTVTVKTSTAAVDSYFIGTWYYDYDYDKAYPLVVDKNGTVTMFNVTFTLDSASKEECTFTSTDGKYTLRLVKEASFMCVYSNYDGEELYYLGIYETDMSEGYGYAK